MEVDEVNQSIVRRCDTWRRVRVLRGWGSLVLWPSTAWPTAGLSSTDTNKKKTNKLQSFQIRARDNKTYSIHGTPVHVVVMVYHGIWQYAGTIIKSAVRASVNVLNHKKYNYIFGKKILLLNCTLVPDEDVHCLPSRPASPWQSHCGANSDCYAAPLALEVHCDVVGCAAGDVRGRFRCVDSHPIRWDQSGCVYSAEASVVPSDSNPKHTQLYN